MTEYIEKTKAIEEIEDFKGSVTRDSSAEWDGGVDEGFEYAVSVIELMAAADVAPVKRGKWIDKNTPMHLYSPWNRFKCSVCGECDECSYNFKYCPHCGALMDGGKK